MTGQQVDAFHPGKLTKCLWLPVAYAMQMHVTAENGKSYALLFLHFCFKLLFFYSFFFIPRATLLPVYTTCIFRCCFTSVKKQRSRTRPHRQTDMPWCICILSYKDRADREQLGRVQCNLKRNNHTQRGTRRNVWREKRTGPVTLESGSSAAAATSTPSSSSNSFPPPSFR